MGAAMLFLHYVVKNSNPTTNILGCCIAENRKELIFGMHKMSITEQKAHLNKTLEEWMSHTDITTGERYVQMDDILVIGIKIK